VHPDLLTLRSEGLCHELFDLVSLGLQKGHSIRWLVTHDYGVSLLVAWLSDNLNVNPFLLAEIGTLVTDGTAFKGMVLKHQVTTPDPEDETKERVKDVYTTHMSRATKDGLEHFWSPKQVAGFLKEHADTFKRHILDTYSPYGDSATPQENGVLDMLSLDKMLPGCDKAGLLPDQRAIAVALCRPESRGQANRQRAAQGSTDRGAALPGLPRVWPAAG
jgi:hypothetical protein